MNTKVRISELRKYEYRDCLLTSMKLVAST